ncbi:hypothetical protein NLI96_g7474 [Meripilus lineatus]|uniref:Uncharacterized protein n=1 Tax=Meripilus lineatus TaxID=2056292 RepID=A0AAD5YH56_9APHY|nr:hypothetical protein NLI96_g7474 [Physisporinus lineatus]
MSVENFNRSISLAPRLPVEVQLHIVALSYSRNVYDEKVNGLLSSYILKDIRERLDCLLAWALVCHAWTSDCQERLFAFAHVNNSTKLDRLRHTLRQPSSLHFADSIQRICVAYPPPFYKLGEALLRIVSMRLPNLVQIHIVGDPLNGGLMFPLRPSLLAQASQLQNVRRLQLRGFHFKHLAELRRFICVFRGLESLILEKILFGNDKRGDLRALHQTTGVVLRSVNFIPIFPIIDEGARLSCLWIAPLSNYGFSRRSLFEKTQESHTRPVVSLSVAELFINVLRPEPFRHFDPQSWEWMCHSRDEWTLQNGGYRSPNVGMRFIKTQLQPADSRDARIHRAPYFDLDHLKEISVGFPDGTDLNEQTWNQDNVAIFTLQWYSLSRNNKTRIVLSDIVDNSTARLITELSREISGLRIEVRGVPVQLQDLAKERSETEDEEKTDDKVDKEDTSVGTQ